jgi:reductive dehalogenase
MRLFSNARRPVHLGPYPLEDLPRTSDIDLDRSPRSGSVPASRLSPSIQPYMRLFSSLRDGEVAPRADPLTGDPGKRAENLKAGIYFLDADQSGTGPVPDKAWLRSALSGHTHTVVILVAEPPEPLPGAPGHYAIQGAGGGIAMLRAAEIAVITAGYLRQLGFAARAHFGEESDVDVALLGRACGLTTLKRGLEIAPFVGAGFQLAAVTTDYEIAHDAPLAANAMRASKGMKAFVGWGGTRPGWKRLDGRHRPLHLGRYPMEKISRRETPTTWISDSVPRVPKRANFFTRALHGDLGPKPKAERSRFAVKTPSSFSYTPLIRGMVPLQTGETSVDVSDTASDPSSSADTMKAIAHALGGDMTGICAIPDYAWYSHQEDGSDIQPYHRNAIVILIDQGFETMEGASGDDWISGAQSMRAYMRGAEIAGVLADHIRSLGHAARSHTNFDSDLLHIPLVLQAGLGELSRIGELVLNPFVGPRFKSVVVSTDMPLTADKPIDFGLQDFCGKCNKCARECPCGAIPFGGKTIFNGYEIWKPDAEKCVRYRVTNQKGSACGRCMKTCPFNAEGLMTERAALWTSIKIPALRGPLARLDDRLRRGSINPVKKWWFDLELIDGKAVEPKAGTNARSLDFDRKIDADSQKIAHYPVETAPPPGATKPHPVDRKDALRRAEDARQKMKGKST